MLIHFVHVGSAYLPELGAYVDYIRSTGHDARVHKTFDTIPTEAAVVWWMCGLVPLDVRQRWPAALHIHEYASASVGRLCRYKDLYKQLLQPRPDYRIFLNTWVRSRLGFSDDVPFEYRDMGIPPYYYGDAAAVALQPEFDFVYLGEMQRLNCFRPVFEGLAQLRKTVLLIGELQSEIRDFFESQPNVTAVGRVSQTDVPLLLRRARWGLNLVPHQLPYIQQTSTKLLEYCATELRVVSTDYPWVRSFERRHNASFYFIPFEQSPSTYARLLGDVLESHTAPNAVVLRDQAWPEILRNLAVWKAIGMSS